jgi:hypothetical protein
MNLPPMAVQTVTDELENPSGNKWPNVYSPRQLRCNTIEYCEYNDPDERAACVDRSVIV